MNSDGGKALFATLQTQISSCLGAVDALDFDRSLAAADEARAIVEEWQADTSIEDEDTLNDLAVLGFLARFLSEYAIFWERVTKRNYEPSWIALQDCLDSIRLMKRVSRIDVARFEDQLWQLENVYPYKMFASIGCIAGRVECSICGQDIDSLDCVHRRGELYRGKMAYGIVREIKHFDHVAMTENPEDKRCIMKLKGSDYEFPAIDWLADHLMAKNFKVSDFMRVQVSERRKRDEKIARQGRNEPCQCGSGHKFKGCCGAKEYITYPHAEFIFRGDGASNR